MPFEGVIEKKINYKTLNKSVKYSSKAWKQCSPEAKKLTQALICKNHETRLSINDMLKHDWFKSVADNKRQFLLR